LIDDYGNAGKAGVSILILIDSLILPYGTFDSTLTPSC